MTVFYRNWTEICVFSRLDQAFMFVLASVPMEENNPIFAGLYRGFPQCFSTEKKEGPIPLSFIRAKGGDSALMLGGNISREYGERYPFEFGGVPEEVPVIFFHAISSHDANIIVFPDRLVPSSAIEFTEASKLKQGDVFEWKGKTFVILETIHQTEGVEWFSIVATPSSAVAVDL